MTTKKTTKKRTKKKARIGRPPVHTVQRERLQLRIGANVIAQLQEYAENTEMDRNTACVDLLEEALQNPTAVERTRYGFGEIVDLLAAKEKFVLQAPVRTLGKIEKVSGKAGISRAAWISLALLSQMA